MMAGSLTLETLNDEFVTFLEGVEAFAAEMAKSEDAEEVGMFTATVHEWRQLLYRAEQPATSQRWWLECLRRNMSLSHTETS